MYLWIIVVF